MAEGEGGGGWVGGGPEHMVPALEAMQGLWLLLRVKWNAVVFGLRCDVIQIVP